MVVHLFELDRWRRDLIVAAVTERLRRNFSLKRRPEFQVSEYVISRCFSNVGSRKTTFRELNARLFVTTLRPEFGAK